MSRHTPGPWFTDGDQIWHQSLESLRIYVAATKLRTTDWQANARLIAAAPELLAALCDCADRLSGVSGVSDPIGRARTAIALATGEES